MNISFKSKNFGISFESLKVGQVFCFLNVSNPKEFLIKLNNNQYDNCIILQSDKNIISYIDIYDLVRPVNIDCITLREI